MKGKEIEVVRINRPYSLATTDGTIIPSDVYPEFVTSLMHGDVVVYQVQQGDDWFTVVLYNGRRSFVAFRTTEGAADPRAQGAPIDEDALYDLGGD